MESKKKLDTKYFNELIRGQRSQKARNNKALGFLVMREKQLPKNSVLKNLGN